jgi:prepilin-type N-terminal cleavage/methylation domain-containing protein/prepilin-type processing-associated H-X9-DG protein
MKAERGFTLIELLVVIAILALLIAIIVPALKEAKLRTQGAVCLSNLRQVGVGVLLYAEDNENIIPSNSGGDISMSWAVSFLPYLGAASKEIFDYREIDIYNCSSYPVKEQTIDYVVNSWGDLDDQEFMGGFNITKFKNPAGKIYLADNEDGDWRDIVTDEESYKKYRGELDVWHLDHLPTGPDEQRRVAKQRHRDGCNSLYLDGHSDWVKGEVMTEMMWHYK